MKGERGGRRTSGSIENFSIGQSATQSSSTLLSLPSPPPSSSGQSCCSQSKELWERGGGGRAFLSLDPCFPFPLLRCPFILQKKCRDKGKEQKCFPFSSSSFSSLKQESGIAPCVPLFSFSVRFHTRPPPPKEKKSVSEIGNQPPCSLSGGPT